MRTIYSFDVFDTCLSRLCGSPRNLIEVLSVDVLRKMGINSSDNEHLRQLFVAARLDSDGSLEEKYAQVAKIIPLPCSIKEMVDMELSCERKMLKPIKHTFNLIESLRRDGDIIFISDMYLPSSFIKEILIKFDFFKEGDILYVSDEIGAWKRDGSLYKLIHNQRGIPYKKWVHYGDNIRSDVQIPRKLGIHTHHLSFDYLPYEKQWKNIPSFRFQYASIVAGISRSIRLMRDASSSHVNFVCDISAPLLVARVVHIMNEIQKRNIQDIFFCARDSHSEYLISKCISIAFPNIIPHYLFISREARDKDHQLLLKYLKQEGVASKKSTAIVDASTNGDTIKIINTLLCQNGYEPCLGYSLLYLNIYKNIPHQENELIHSDLMNLYTNILPYEGFKKAMNTLFPEHLFSLNLHRKTIGYSEHYGKIAPVFGEDDNNGIQVPKYKELKRINDDILTAWAKSFIITNCTSYADNVLYQIGLPSYLKFLVSPRKEYVGWLKHIQKNGDSMVKRVSLFNFLKLGNSWVQGCLAESLPTKTSQFVIKIIDSPRFRRFFNNK